MPTKTKNLEYELTPGVWRWWFHHKNSITPLCPISQMHIERKTKITFALPDHLKHDKEAIIFLVKTR